MRHRLLVLSALFALACGSAPRAAVISSVDAGDLDRALAAYESFRASEGSDPGLLGRVATIVLLREAAADGEEERRAAIGQLGLAGTAGMPLLQRIASDVEHPARLDALVALARRGHADARLGLRAFADDEDPHVRAASIVGMDPELDRELLMQLAEHENEEVRREAIGCLRRAIDDARVVEIAVRLARVDAAPSVRAAAVRTLGAAGSGGVEALRERMSDPQAMVRLAAITALYEADAVEARYALMPLLEIAPSAAGIEAARLIALEADTDQPGPSAARAFLRRALASDDASLRAQVAVALSSLPIDSGAPLEALVGALDAERDPDVRVALARALFRHAPAAARSALASLLDSEGMPRVQAATLLAAEGDEQSRDVLAQVVFSNEPSIVRRTAARALARDALEPDAVREALRDGDALVRIYAAGGILAAAAAS